MHPVLLSMANKGLHDPDTFFRLINAMDPFFFNSTNILWMLILTHFLLTGEGAVLSISYKNIIY